MCFHTGFCCWLLHISEQFVIKSPRDLKQGNKILTRYNKKVCLFFLRITSDVFPFSLLSSEKRCSEKLPGSRSPSPNSLEQSVPRGWHPEARALRRFRSAASPLVHEREGPRNHDTIHSRHLLHLRSVLVSFMTQTPMLVFHDSSVSFLP